MDCRMTQTCGVQEIHGTYLAHSWGPNYTLRRLPRSLIQDLVIISRNMMVMAVNGTGRQRKLESNHGMKPVRLPGRVPRLHFGAPSTLRVGESRRPALDKGTKMDKAGIQ